MDLIKAVDAEHPVPLFLGLNGRLRLLPVTPDMDPRRRALTCLQEQNQLEQTGVSFLACWRS